MRLLILFLITEILLFLKKVIRFNDGCMEISAAEI